MIPLGQPPVLYTPLELWQLGGRAAARSKTAGRLYSIRAHRRARMLQLVDQHGRTR